MQLLWIIIAALVLGVHLFGLQARIDILRLVVPFGNRVGQLNTAQAAALGTLGLTPQLYYGWVLFTELAMAGGAFGVALLAFIRRRDDWVVLLFSLMIIAFVCTNTNFTRALDQQFTGILVLRRWLQALGLALLLPVFCTFPDGQFAPRWARWLCLAWVIQVLLWLANLLPLNPLPGSSIGQPAIVGGIYLFSWIGVAVAALLLRLRQATPGTQRQQLRWAMSGIAAACGVAFVSYMAEGLLNWLNLVRTAQQHVVVLLTIRPLYYLATALIVPLFIGPALLRYGLWGFRPLLTRTLTFASITTLLIILYLSIAAGIGLLLGQGSTAITVSAALTAALATLLFAPLQRLLQRALARRLYRDRSVLGVSFDALGDTLRTTFDQAQIAQTLATRVAALLPAEHAQVLLYDTNRTLTSAASAGPSTTVALTPAALTQLEAGAVARISHPIDAEDMPQSAQSLNTSFSVFSVFSVARRAVTDSNQPAVLLVPIRAVVTGQRALVGVLALGPHRSEQPYDHEHLRLLIRLGNDAGDALTVAQALQDARALETYRASPAGQAEALAQQLLANRTTALEQLHTRAGDDTQHEVFALLPVALRQAGDSQLAQLAELLARLPDATRLPAALAALPPALAAIAATPYTSYYAALASALHSNDLVAISAWQPPAYSELDPLCSRLAATARALATALPPQDAPTRLVALAQALALLTTLPAIPAPSGYAATAIVRHWSALIDTARQGILGTAQLDLTLLTRQVIAAPVVMLRIQLRNSGIAPATQVHLAPGIGSQLAFHGAPLAPFELAPGTIIQLTQPVILLTNQTPLDMTLELHYDDPSAAGQALQYNARLAVLQVPAYTHPLVNPFIPGTPLEPASPVFVGRASDLAWIHNLATSAHGPPLLITGQRRMGKTSLLLRLTHAFADSHLVIFADGQALAIDPTPGSLFSDLAFVLCAAAGIPTILTDSAHGLLHQVLPAVVAAAAPRRVLLLLDEFEELEQRLRAGRFGSEVFGLLRHIAQHNADVQTVLVGGNRPAALADDFWIGLLNVALHRRVSALDESAARALVGCAPLVFDDTARDGLLALAGGHPYVLQLCCHTLVSQANDAGRSYVLSEHLAAMVETVLERGEAHFASLWAEASPAEQQMLAALAATPLHQHTQLQSEPAVVDRLLARELVVRSPSGNSITWRLALLGHWISFQGL